jgi:hypothetical protein
MADGLEVSHRPSTPEPPRIGLEEASTQQVVETRLPLPAEPGKPARYDDEYARHGVSNLCMFFAPLDGGRQVKVTDRRTKIDWAHARKDVLTVHLPEAEQVTMVRDHLTTHHPASLYEAFQPEEAKALLHRCAFHYTPQHGSWLNMAEIECSALQRQGLDRRLPDQETLRAEVAAWEAQRHAQGVKVHWRFTTADARIRLERLYPSIKN